jgi:hypothetical protein
MQFWAENSGHFFLTVSVKKSTHVWFHFVLTGLAGIRAMADLDLAVSWVTKRRTSMT